ncbi:MAG: hypothetical protein QOD02_4533 [Mycobacterium sp.]|jgi:hypothetical protein|nr:hypothetical protein [Mycobacterium sp.]
MTANCQHALDTNGHHPAQTNGHELVKTPPVDQSSEHDRLNEPRWTGR